MNKNKIRITPLNFATAFFLSIAVYVLLYGVNVMGGHYPHVLKSGLFAGVFFLFAFVVAFMDILLRNFFNDIKKLWWVELSFITLAIILFLMAK